MKNLARRLAKWVVTYYYSRIYRKAVKFADKQHEKYGERYYVVDHLVKGQNLTVVNRAMFRKMKRDAMSIYNPSRELFMRNDYTIKILKDGAWYFTADRGGNGAISPLEKRARYLFFIKVGLHRAKLIDRVVEPKEDE